MTWTPASWRERPAAQLPEYPDAGALARHIADYRAGGSATLLDLHVSEQVPAPQYRT